MKLSSHEIALLLAAYKKKGQMSTEVGRLANSSEDYKKAFTRLYEAGFVTRWWCTITDAGKKLVETGVVHQKD